MNQIQASRMYNGEGTERFPHYFTLRKKLFSAAALLLVSAILLVSTTYAWFVLSTAPEVTGIQTQVGANGALEIALLDQESWNDLSRLDMGDIDENGTQGKNTPGANLTWGNLVDLADASYALDQIVLNPSRLAIDKDGTAAEDGTQTYKINTVPLKVPVYGEDGRVKSLDATAAVTRIAQKRTFSAEGYGVRAIGTSSSMSVFQLGLNAARAGIATATAAARTEASNTLNQNGADLATIVVKYALKNDNETVSYTKDDVAAIRKLAQGLGASLDQIKAALRQAFAGYITSQGSGVNADTYADALAEITNETTTLEALLQKYPGIKQDGYPIDTYITKLGEDRAKVTTALSQCDAWDTKIDAGEVCGWSDLSAIVRPLADPDQMTIGGKTIDEVKKTVKNQDGSINFDAAFALVNGGVKITVPSGSGVVSDIADFAGDYSANVVVKDFKYGSIGPMDVKATMQTATKASPVYLQVCANSMRAYTTQQGAENPALTDYYGYAVDLAFRTNAAGTSKLLLQTEPENRIYEGDTQNSALQGAGSYMEFKTQAGLSATKMVKLLGGIRVVFMDKDQRVFAIAALDTTLGKDVYKELSDSEKTETKMYAYLNGSASSYQNSDLITKAEYDALAGTSAVTFDTLTGTVKAKLYLYNFSKTVKGEGEDAHETGALSLGTKRTDATITTLQQDRAQIVTALVYLDGSVVNNSMVAANSAQSMTGTLNLQFASDAELMPMQNTELQRGKEATTAEAETSKDEESGGTP